MRGAGYYTNLDQDEVAEMLCDSKYRSQVLEWVAELITDMMPLHAFIAKHEEPDVLMQMLADRFPESVSVDSEYE